MLAFIKSYSGIIITAVICLALGSFIWLWIDNSKLKAENARNNENWRQEVLEDSLHYKQLQLTQGQINDYLKTDNKTLLKYLQDANIKTNRIESIISQLLTYRDTTTQKTDFSALVAAINKREGMVIPFVDSTKCLVVRGNLKYKNDSLTLNVTSRDFKNKTDVVAYWQRREWKLLFWKTRFLGKKEFTAKTFSECGEIGTVKIEKAN